MPPAPAIAVDSLLRSHPRVMQLWNEFMAIRDEVVPDARIAEAQVELTKKRDEYERRAIEVPESGLLDLRKELGIDRLVEAIGIWERRDARHAPRLKTAKVRWCEAADKVIIEAFSNEDRRLHHEVRKVLATRVDGVHGLVGPAMLHWNLMRRWLAEVPQDVDLPGRVPMQFYTLGLVLPTPPNSAAALLALALSWFPVEAEGVE